MMVQYREIKTQYPGYLLFYRMGDFYELFADDACLAADILQITLTKRRTAKQGDAGIPMCGVPHHAAENYIAKLIDAGHKVALCEQAETPEEAKKRGGSKALVKREVVRLYTGGTLTEDHLLPSDSSRWLAALSGSQDKWCLAWLDLSGGTFGIADVTKETLAAELAALNPAEILITSLAGDTFNATLAPYSLTQDDAFFSPTQATQALEHAFTQAPTFSSDTQTTTAGALVAYAEHTQVGKLPPLQMPQVQNLPAS